MKYGRGFVKRAIKLSDEIGLKKASEQLDVPYYTLADWRRYRKTTVDRPLFTMMEAERLLPRLQRQVLILREENARLREALSKYEDVDKAIGIKRKERKNEEKASKEEPDKKEKAV